MNAKYIIVEIDSRDLVLFREGCWWSGMCDSLVGVLIRRIKKVLPSNYRLPDEININDFVNIPSPDDMVRYSYPVDKLVKMNTNKDHDLEMFGFR